MANINGWSIETRQSVRIFISESGKNVIAKDDQGILAELIFLDSGFRIIHTRAELTVDEQKKTILIR
ncbi:hypothetical protein [Paenibacillus elgii]|uniref:hypothetical protein n=1 Tax=Paenibacillus elgii TaxID=189691 RepID=UPI000248CFF8|nr:hypothetical protein [Paenibacillus elgii]